MEKAAIKANKLGVILQENTRVIGLDRAKKKVITDKGLFNYNTLVLAAGSSSAQSKFKYSSVMSINDLDSYAAFKHQLSNKKRVTIVGGGFIGCELADDLSQQVSVALVNKAQHLLKTTVPEPVAEELEHALASKGVLIHNNCSVRTIRETQVGTVCELSDGSELVSDIVLMCTGTRSVSEFSRLANLECGDLGICVDNTMRTSDPAIYALGDCVEIKGQVYRYIEPIKRQAKTVAARITGSNANLEFSFDNFLVKIKTSSYPIWIHTTSQHRNVDQWRIVKKGNNGGLGIELLGNSGVTGSVVSGALVRGK